MPGPLPGVVIVVPVLAVVYVLRKAWEVDMRLQGAGALHRLQPLSLASVKDTELDLQDSRLHGKEHCAEYFVHDPAFPVVTWRQVRGNKGARTAGLKTQSPSVP